MSHWLRKRLVSMLFTLALGIGLLVPAYPAAAVPGIAVTPTLQIQAGSLPNLIDPQLSSFVQEVGHVKLIYEGLTRQDSQLAIAPGAAESWSFSTDGRQVTFNLRAGSMYSDGTLLNAKRFEYSILRALDPRLRAEYASVLDMITGAVAYRTADPNGPIAVLNGLRAAVGVHALDASNIPCTNYAQTDCLKLQIDLVAPNMSFLSVMSLWVTYPVKEELVNSGGASWWASPANQIGNGPFIMTDYNTNGRSRFVPNPRYWRGSPTYAIEYEYVSDSAIAFDLYKKGLLDIIYTPFANMAEIQANPTLKSELKTYAGSCTFAIMFNNAKAPFNDPKVRQAFAYAFNRQAWVQEVMGGYGIPTLSWIPPGMPGYQPGETRWSYDSVKGIQALNASSYGGATGLPVIKLTYSDSPRNTFRNQWLADQWHAVLGVSVVLEPLDSTTYNNRVKDPATAPQTYILGWCGDYPDPQNYLSVYWRSSSSFAARIGYANPNLDALLDQADIEQNPAQRLALYQQAQTMLVGDVPAAMGWTSMNSYLVKSYVTGAIGTAMDGMWMGDVDPLTITVNKSYLFLPFAMR